MALQPQTITSDMTPAERDVALMPENVPQKMITSTSTGLDETSTMADASEQPNVVVTKDVGAAMSADIRRQRGEGVSVEELQIKFNNIINAPDLDAAVQLNDNNPTLGGLALSDELLQNIRTDEGFRNQALSDYVDEATVPLAKPDELVVPGEYGLPDSFFEGTDYDFKQAIDGIVATNKRVRDALTTNDPYFGIDGKRLILSKFAVGDTYDETMRMLKALPGDVARMPYIFPLITNSVQAVWQSATGDRSFGDALPDNFGKLMAQSGYIKASEEVLNKSIITDSNASAMQRWYKDSFIKEYGQDEWNRQHTQPLVELNEQGQKDYIRDENGMVKRRDVGLPPQVANAMLELAFNELPFASKVGVLFAQQAGFTAGAIKIATRQSKDMVKRVGEARNSNPTNYLNKTDFEVYEMLRREDFSNAVQSNIGLQAAFFGARDLAARIPGAKFTGVPLLLRQRRKSLIDIGGTFRERADTITRYENSVDEIGQKIDSLTPKPVMSGGKPPPISADAAKEIEVLRKQQKEIQTNLDSYKKTTRSNPYLTAGMRDEAIISSAMGLGMEVLPDMSVFGVPSDLLIGITAPMIAPTVTYGASKIAWKAGDSVTEGLFTDVASLLQHSDMFPFIPRDAILKGDERAMQEALRSSGYDLNSDRIKSFNQFSRILKAMPTTDGKGGNPRLEVTNALTRYSDMMRSYRTDLEASGMSTDRMAEVMNKLNLSVAQASGLAPLIAYQQQKVTTVTAGKLVDPKDMAELIRATADEASLHEGINANIQIIRDQFAADGIQLTENSPLQKFIGDLETGAVQQRDAMREKQQQLVVLFDQYTKNISNLSDVDDTVVGDMMKVANDLEAMSILPEGTVSGLVETGKLLDNAATNMLTSVQESSANLTALSSNMERSQFIQHSRRLSDQLLDITHERRRAVVSKEYRKVDELLGDRKFDLAPVVRKMMVLSGDIEDSPITQNLTDFGRFLKTDGKAVSRTFESMAERNLVEVFGVDPTDLKAILDQKRAIDGSDSTMVDVAIDFIESNGIDPQEASSIFAATFSEAEDLHRFFEIRAIGSRTDDFEIVKVKREMRGLINDTYGELDMAVKKQVETARSTHAQEIGARTDLNVDYAYMGPALANRVRRDAPDRPAGEGRYSYRNIDRNHPEVPFLNMAKISQKLLNTKDAGEVQSLMGQLAKEQDRVLYAIGGKRNSSGNIEFDLNDPKQKKAFHVYKNLVQAHQQFAVTEYFRMNTDTAVSLLQENMDNVPKRLGALDFNRSHRMFDIEKALAVDVIEEGGGLSTYRTVEMEDLTNLAQDFDDLLLNSTTWQKGYNELREKLDPTKGVLALAAKAEQDDMNILLKGLQVDAALVNKKEAFFDVYFANATPQSHQRKVDELAISSGMPKEDVQKAMKFMYMEGLMAKSKMKFNVKGTSGQETMSATGELFSEIVSNPEQIKLMDEVIGINHRKSLQRMQNWVDTAMGDSLDMRRSGVSGVITIDSAFSRIFNVARGMVSPLYVGTELASRALLLNKQNLMDAALSDPQAAEIMAKILITEQASPEEIKILGRIVEGHLAKGVVASGSNIPALEEIQKQEEHYRTYGTIVNPIQAASQSDQETENETVQ